MPDPGQADSGTTGRPAPRPRGRRDRACDDPVSDTEGLLCRGLVVAPGGNPVIRDLDLHVPRGGLSVVVGPSGAGKTTLLRAIAGLIAPRQGRILLGGRDLTGLRPRRRGIGMVFQTPRLFPNLDVAANVAFPLRVAGADRDRQRETAQRLLEQVGLEGFSSRRVQELSGGEQQRVALGRALAADPELLILDEPLAAVDPERRESLRRLLLRLHGELQLTTLHVTHDRAEAAELGDELALLLEGRIIQHGPPEELFERPGSAVVARFMGSPNLLSGHLGTQGRMATAFGPLTVTGPAGPATVTFRPEAVRLDRDGPLEGRLVEATYVGGAVRAVLARGTDRIRAHLDQPLDAPVGTELRFRVPAGRVWRLPGGGPHSGRAEGTSP